MNKVFFSRIVALSLVICHLLLFSCGNRNSPNLPEKKLRALLETLQLQSPKEGVFSAGNREIPQGTKYFPERLKTPAPIRIDIIAGMQNVKDITLSEIASDITYVKLEDISGIRLSGSSRSTIYNVTIIDNHFLINSIDGVYLFDRDGKFVKQFVANHVEKMTDPRYPDMLGITEFDGVVNTWYNPNEQQLISHSRNFGPSNNMNYTHPDYNPNHPRGGIFIVDVNEIVVENMNEDIYKAHSIFENSARIPCPTVGSFGQGNPAGFGDGFVVAHYKTTTGMDCITFSNQGDTLCRFPIFSSNTEDRGFTQYNPPPEMRYYYNDKYTFRHLYNDTVFRILSPNVIQPAYILDFGKYSLTYDAVFNRINELQDYIICSALCEDNQYLYMRFNKGFDSPNNKRADKVKFYWGLYHKASGSFSVLPFNSSLPDRGNEEGITNDIDGGMRFWPKSIDSQGRKITLMSGKVIKETLTDQWLSNSKASSPEKKETLRQFVKTLTDNDQVIVVVK